MIKRVALRKWWHSASKGTCSARPRGRAPKAPAVVDAMESDSRYVVALEEALLQSLLIAAHMASFAKSMQYALYSSV